MLSVAAPSANAQIIVSDAILEFKNSQRLIENIAVGNADKNRSFNIVSKIYEIKNPGATEEETIETDTLFTVPEQFSLSPRTQRTVRFAIKERPDTEKVYKVVFKPEILNKSANENSKINIVTSTSVMAVVNPPNPEDDLSWVREDERIIFTNTGNTNIILRQVNECAPNIQCQIPGQRLWANDRWILNLPPSLQTEEIALEYRALGKIREVVIPYNE